MTALLVASCFLVCVVSASSQDSADGLSDDMFKKMFEKADADKDGKMSFQELLDFSHHTGVGLAQKDSAALLEKEIMGNKDGFYTLDEHICLLLGVEFDQARKGVLESGEKCDTMPMSDMARAEFQKTIDLETLKFLAADADHDGHLDKTELHHLLSPETHPEIIDITVNAYMHKHDENKDRQLSESEFNYLQQSMPNEEYLEDLEFAKVDHDGDGFLSKEELKNGFPGKYNYRGRIADFFHVTDTNEDDSLSLDEFLIGKEKMADDEKAIKLAKDWGAHHDMLEL